VAGTSAALDFLVRARHDAFRLGLMDQQLGQVRIAPVGEADDLTGDALGPEGSCRLEGLEAHLIDDEGVLAGHAAKPGHRGMLVGQHLGAEPITSPACP
jgi:hypothetical protein